MGLSGRTGKSCRHFGAFLFWGGKQTDELWRSAMLDRHWLDADLFQKRSSPQKGEPKLGRRPALKRKPARVELDALVERRELLTFWVISLPLRCVGMNQTASQMSIGASGDRSNPYRVSFASSTPNAISLAM
jgi:hypothetical protein